MQILLDLWKLRQKLVDYNSCLDILGFLLTLLPGIPAASTPLLFWMTPLIMVLFLSTPSSPMKIK